MKVIRNTGQRTIVVFVDFHWCRNHEVSKEMKEKEIEFERCPLIYGADYVRIPIAEIMPTEAELEGAVHFMTKEGIYG